MVFFQSQGSLQMRAVDSRELLLKASQMGKANLGPEDSKM